MRLTNSKRVFVALLAFFSPLAGTVFAQQAPLVPSRITHAIDESSRVTLKGSIHPLANAANDLGPASDSMQLERIHLFFKRSDAQEAALKQLITAMHTPGSPNYHKWLTPDQFAQQFGPSHDDVAAIQSWLISKGFQVNGVKPGNQVMEFSGTVKQLRDAFNTQMHQYSVNGESHFANANEPDVPSALAPVFGGFVSLNNFHARRQAQYLGKATYDPATHKVSPQWTYPAAGGVFFVVSPGDFAVQYDLNPLYGAGTNGAGQTIAIINDANINVDLVNEFRSIFGLSVNPPQVIIDGNDPGIDGINNPDGPNFDSIEAYLDTEWSGAVAPGATIDLVIAADTAVDSGLFLAAEHAVFANVAPVVSLSFGDCEAALGGTDNAFFNSLWEQAASQGQTILVSSGDNGSAGCDSADNAFAVDGLGVNGFASTPFDTAVGGTDFFYSAFASGQTALNAQIATFWNTTSTNSPAVSLMSPIPEQPWNDSQFGLDVPPGFFAKTGSTTIVGGSGGASIVYTKPSWQTGAGVPADGARDIPDVSLFASNGANFSFYPSCATDGDCQPGGTPVQISGAGGTSFSSPEFAGIMALINQKYGRQGLANLVLYPLKAQFPAAFHDVTHGTNSVPCEFAPTKSPNCISAGAGAIVLGGVTEGQLGTGSTPDYNAAAGYNLATGLGTVDANVLVTDWNKITFTGTTTSLVPSSTSFTHGTSITISGTVTGSSPTGNVALMTDSTEPVNQGQTFFPLTSGSYTGNLDFLPGGVYNIWGTYSGDSTNASSSSPKIQIAVTPEASSTYFAIVNDATPFTGTVAINSGTGNIPYGTQLLLDADPFPTTYFNKCINTSSPPSSCSTTFFSTPTGTVTFSDNSNPINTADVNAAGRTEFNTAFAVGAHSVTASYSGDNSYNSSAASAITFGIAKATPQIGWTTFAPVNGSAHDGGPTTINILVENTANLANENSVDRGFFVPATPPSGTVSISGFPAGVPTSVNLNPAVDPVTGLPDGVAILTIPLGTAPGNYTVTFTYGGDSNYNLAAFIASVQIGGSAAGLLTSTTSAGISGGISPTTAIQVTGTVTGQSGHPAPTGFVEFSSSGYGLGEIALTAGAGDVSNFTATLNSQNLFQGSNLITVQYLGDATYAPSSTTLNSGSSISNSLSDFSLVPQTTIIPVAPGGAGTDAVTVFSVNGFSGTVTFNCAGATGIICTIPAPVILSSGGNAAFTLHINASSPLASGNYNVLLTGTSGSFVHTLGIQAFVGQSINLLATPPSPMPITISSPGQTGTSTVTATAENGLTGTVNFSVVMVPSSLTDPPVCTFLTASAPFSGGIAQSMLSCPTTAPSEVIFRPANRPQGPGWLKVMGVFAASAALAFLLLYMPVRRRRAFALFAAVALIVIGFGCGGGGNHTSGGTTPGTYNAIVTASVTNGAVTITESTNIPVVVQ